MRKPPLFALIGLFWVLFMSPGHLWAQAEDIFEDSAAYGYDLEQQQEDEIFFYESRFVDIGANIGGRTFTGGLGKLFGTGFSIGGFFTYFFTRRFALEVMANNSWHKYLIDGKRGTATLTDVMGRLKYYFASDKYSKALSFANPHIFIGGGQFFRKIYRSDTNVGDTSNGPAVEFGGGFEIPLKERTLFIGIRPSFQLVFFQDESDKTGFGTKMDGDTVSFVGTLTYSF